MSWFVLARVLFIAAVGYSAFQVEPFALGAAGNIAVGLCVGAGIVALEISLKGLSVTSLLGAFAFKSLREGKAGPRRIQVEAPFIRPGCCIGILGVAPVHLCLDGGAQLAVSPACLRLGWLFLGGQRRRNYQSPCYPHGRLRVSGRLRRKSPSGD